MITPEEALKNPELMIKYKDDLKDVEIFEYPWYGIFRIHPHLYREFSDRFDKMDREDIAFALRDDPTLVLDLKNHLHNLTASASALRDTPVLVLDPKGNLHKAGGAGIDWLLCWRPELSLCMKYIDNPDEAEAAYYITFPHKLDNLNKEEKREMGKKIIELLREEKI